MKRAKPFVGTVISLALGTSCAQDISQNQGEERSASSAGNSQSANVDRKVVPSGLDNLVEMAVMASPRASCKLRRRGSTLSIPGMALDADDQGIVRFYSNIETSSIKSESDSLVIDCSSSGGIAEPVRTVDPAAARALANVRTSVATSIHPAFRGDIQTASQSDLAAQGYPPRPDPTKVPNQFKNWLKVVSAPQNRVSPGTIPHLDVRNTMTSGNWSGVVMPTPPSGATYEWVEGTWTLPSLSSPHTPSYGGPINGSIGYNVSFWVGMDGVGSPDVAQAGVRGNIYDLFDESGAYSSSYANYGAWIEWYPNSENGISLPVSAGDRIYTQVWIGDSSGNVIPGGAYCWLYMYNYNTGNSYYGNTGRPGGTSFYGNVAEWITERPTICNWDLFSGWSCYQPDLANYGSFYVEDMETTPSAYATDGNYYDYVHLSPTTYTMVGASSTISDVFPYLSFIDYEWYGYN